jgi:hypothetical protein
LFVPPHCLFSSRSIDTAYPHDRRSALIFINSAPASRERGGRRRRRLRRTIHPEFRGLANPPLTTAI